ncbi:MAG: hypothetical protein LBE56_12795 [Tannerella sp.]|jgi:hypothetical protein|nr:hypothetical protein [Tannerella sp.]
MANTFSPYQRASLAQFTPISAQQMWAPITFAIEQEQKGMDMLSTLDGDLNRAAIMAVGDPDGERIINQYREKLKSAGQNLYVNGVTPRTMQDVRSLQNMFSQAVTPLMVGFANRDAYYKRELAKADADPTFRFNHPKMSLTEWATSDVANMPVQGASAAMVQAQVANALAPFAKKTFFDGETLKNLKGFLPVRIGDQDVDTYLSYIERKGYDPDSPEGQILFNAAKANVYEMLKITQNGARNPIFTDTDMFAFDSAANLAKTAMTGETQMNTIKNPEFEMAYQDYKDKRDFDQAMALAQMRIDAAGKGTGTGGSKGEGKGKDGEVTGYNPANLSRSYNEPASTTAIRNEEKIAEANDVISRGKTLDNTVYSKMKNGLESRINLVAQYTYEDRNKDGIPETGFNPENKKKLISRVKDIVGNMESGKYVSIDDMIEDYDRSEAPYEG